MLNTLKEFWPQLPDKEKREISNFVSKQMQPQAAEEAKYLLAHLNKLAHRNFRPVSANLRLIQARLAEGYTREDIEQVIARKCLEWRENPTMSQYLRPATLFNAEKFNQYIGQLDAPLPKPIKPTLKRPSNDQEWIELAKKVGAGRMDSYQEIWHKATIAYDNGRL